MANILTAYFSMKGQTIGPGMKITYQEKGNTMIAAEFIQKAVGGDLFEIEADRNYSEDHMVLIEEAKQELNAGTRVSVKAYPESLEQYDWTGKRIIPFCTNEGSGIGDSVRDIKKICKGADVDSGASFTGSRVSASESKIAEWAKSKL